MNANDVLLGTSMAPQEVSLDVLREKYAKGEEQDVAGVRARLVKDGHSKHPFHA